MTFQDSRDFNNQSSEPTVDAAVGSAAGEALDAKASDAIGLDEMGLDEISSAEIYQQSPEPIEAESVSSNAQFQAQVANLHRLVVQGRWLMVGLLWLTLGNFSLLQLRPMLENLAQYFTWAAIRYGLAFHPVAALCLAICIGMTVGALLWHSRNILKGWPLTYRRQLEQRVSQIRHQGPSHPLWRWVCRE
jgi:hypothetical protein